MSLVYCENCKTHIDDTQAIKSGEQDYCPKCKKPLSYFGSEPVYLSVYPEAYAPTPIDPSQFQGKSVSFMTESIDPGLLEAETMLAHSPNNVDALMYLALSNRTKNKFKRAKELFERIVELNPSHIEAYQNLADIANEEGDFDAAARVIEVLASLDPDNEAILFNLGIAYFQAKKYTEAMVPFSRIVERSQDADMKAEAEAVLELILQRLQS